MMKKFFAILAVIAVSAATFTSCGGSATPKTEFDSVAYAFGVDFGKHILSIDSAMNPNMIAAGIKDAVNHKEKISYEDAVAFLQEYLYVRKPAREREAGAKFLEEVKSNNPRIQQTASGLLYEIVEQGGERPESTAIVKAIYHGTLPDGKIFDSSRDRGDTLTWPLDRLIPGWTEGLMLIGKGGRIKLWMPSDLAYGERGQGSMIPPNTPVVFDVVLVDFDME